MARAIPFKGRHIDPQLIPEGLRKRYILFLTAIYSFLRNQISREVTKSFVKNPTSFMAPSSKLGSSSGSRITPEARMPSVGAAIGKEIDLKEHFSAKRHNYNEGRKNSDFHPQPIEFSEDSKPQDPAISNLIASQLTTSRAGNYSRGRNKYLVLEDECFSEV